MSDGIASGRGEEDVIVIAGSHSGEREVPVRPGPQGWHLPPHVRDPAVARESLAALVEAGADVVLAPTYRTYRRALVPYGESRRAREWTEAAVRVAREGAEQGRERRASAGGTHDRAVRVAGAIPGRLGDEPVGEGRQASADAAVAQDLADFVALVVDAGADLLLVESLGSIAMARAAASAAAATGAETLMAVDITAAGTLSSQEPLDALVEAVEPFAVAALLVAGPASAPDAIAQRLESLRALTQRATGTYLWPPALGASAEAPMLRTAAGRSLAAGATTVGLADAVTPEGIGALRDAAEEKRAAVLGARREAEAAWQTWLARGVERAPGGAAAWLSDRPVPALPDGFGWVCLPAGSVRELPRERFRLVIAPEASDDLASIVGAIEEGGVLVARQAEPFGPWPADLRPLDLSVEGRLRFVVARKTRA